MTDLSILSDIKKEMVDVNERLLEIKQEVKNSHVTQDLGLEKINDRLREFGVRSERDSS